MVRTTTDDATDVRTDALTAAADAIDADSPDATSTGRMNRSKAYDRAFDAAMSVLRDVDLADRPDGLVVEVDDILSRLRDGDVARDDVVADLRDAAGVDDEDDEDDEDDDEPTADQIAESFGVDTDDVDVDDVEVPDYPDPVDVSGYKTAAGAAKKTHEALQDHADAMGFDPDAVVLKRPEDDYQGSGTWAVVWEGGPYEWAVALTGGTSLTGFAGPRMNYDGTPEVQGLNAREHFEVECHFSFDLLFFDR